MKKRKIAKAAVAVLSIMTIGAAGAALTACDGCDDHVHSYGDWTIVGTKPTLTDGGTAERHCEAGDDVETVTLPNLLDTSVWTEGSKVDSTCSVAGSRTFTSDYGTVTITLPLDPSAHTGGTWTITKDPTEDAKGKASHDCEAEIDIPALSDKSVWTEKTSEYVKPTHTKDGKKVYTSVYGTVTVVLPANADAHTYGDWTFVEGEEPSFEEGGRIQHVCGGDSSHIEYHAVPDLNDTDFWSYEIKETPSHLATGLAKYSNSEYEIELDNVVLSKIAHTFGDWVITTEPTDDEGGVATRKCTLAGCKDDESATQTATLPNLKDSAWSKKNFDADYSKPAGTTYTHATYGSFTVYTGVKLPAPYDNKTYTSVNVKINDNTGAAYVEGAWNTATLTVGADSIGYGSAYPFRGKHVFEFVDPDTGLVKITHYNIKSTSTGGGDNTGDDDDYDYSEYSLRAVDEYEETADSVYYAYVDVNSGMLVLQVKNGWSEVTVAVPSDTAVVSGDFKVSDCAGDYIISYIDTNILVTNDGTFFGVSVSDLSGNALTAANCLNNASHAIIIKDKAGKLVKAYALNADSEWVAADGLQGTYTLPDDRKVVVNGASLVKVDGVAGTYEIVSLDERIISVVFGSDYYEYTLSADGLANDATCTEKAPKVSLNYNLNGETITNSITLTNEVSKNVAIDLAAPQHATKEFVGWYTDAACETPVTLVDGKYIPADNATLYANWAARVTLHLNGLLEADADKATLFIGEGVNIHSKLDMYTAHQINENKYFDGWYTNAACTEALAEGAIAYVEDDGMQIYAKWADVHALYGEYSGKQLLSGGYLKEANLIVDVDGTITGTMDNKTIAGKIYYADDKYTWRADGSDKDNSLWFDSDCLIVVPDDFGSATMSTYPFLLSRDGEVGKVEMFDYTVERIKLVEYGEKLALLYDNNVYGNVKIENAYGEALDINSVLVSKTLVVKQGANVVLAIGNAGGKLDANKDDQGNSVKNVALDNYYGVYNIGGVNYKLDGVGGISWNDGNDHSGIYAYVKDDGDDKVFDVFDRERKVETSTGEDEDGDPVTSTKVTYTNVAYYELRLGAANSFTKPEATINFVSSQGTVASVSANIKIPYTLATPDNTTTHVFRGWYEESDFSGDAVTEITLDTTDVKTLHAKWLEKVSVTLDYKDGGDEAIGTSRTEELSYGKGENLANLEEPLRSGFKFLGWFNTTDDSEWNVETQLTADVSLYAKWVNPHVLYGSYRGFEFYSKSDKGSMDQGSYTLEIDVYGNIVNSRGTSYGGKPTDFDESNGGAFKVGGKFAYYDKAGGFIGLAWSNSNSFSNDPIIYSAKEIKTIDYSVYLNSKENSTLGGGRLMLIHYADDTTKLIYVDNNKICSDITVEAIDMSGANVTSIDLNSFTKDNILYFTVKDSKNNVLANSGSNGSSFVVSDNLNGIYTCTDKNNLLLSGGGAFVWGDKSGTYSAVSSSENTYVLNVEQSGSTIECYTAVISGTTYTATESKVTISYTTEHGTQANETVWVNVSHTLPVLSEDGFVFRGWFIDEEGTGDAVTSITPNATSTYTYFAKWDKAITVTVNYGNGMQQVILTEYFANDKVTLDLPEGVIDGKVAKAWHIGSLDGDVWTSDSVITDNVALYCEWITPHALAGIYKGNDFAANGRRNVDMDLTIDAFGNCTGDITGEISDYNPETGTFKIGSRYAYYDAVSKTIAAGYTSTSTELADQVTLLTLVENADVSIATGWKAVNTSDAYLAWADVDGNALYTKLCKITVGGTDKFFLVDNNKVYGNVTIKNGDTPITDHDLSKLKQEGVVLTIVVGNNVIAKYGYNGSTFVFADGTEGEYTGALGNVITDGYGNITVGGVTVVYKVKGGNLHFTANNAMRVIKLNDDETYTQIQDGFAGTYALPDNGGDIVLDGLGGAGDGKTYVVDGTSISIYTGNNVTKYGIDVDGKKFLGKSKFAGLTFNGTYIDSYNDTNSCTITFDDEADIKGQIKCGYYGSFVFTGELVGNVLTLTLTKVITSGGGNTVIMTIEGNKMTRTGGTYNSAYITNNFSATCEGFSL